MMFCWLTLAHFGPMLKGKTVEVFIQLWLRDCERGIKVEEKEKVEEEMEEEEEMKVEEEE